MTLTNGDATNGSSQLTPEKKVLDPTKALEVLRAEYSAGDGLDAKTLLDSKINGGLTYNDFLVLPGYIGTVSPCTKGYIVSNLLFQALLLQMLLWTPLSPSEFPSRHLSSLLPWTQ